MLLLLAGCRNDDPLGQDEPVLPDPITFPISGHHGQNLLSDQTDEIRVSNELGLPAQYSLRAEVPEGKSVRVVMTNLNESLLDGSWVYTPASQQGWGMPPFDLLQRQQVLFADGQVVTDLLMIFLGSGSMRVEVFEDGALVPMFTKTIDWE